MFLRLSQLRPSPRWRRGSRTLGLKSKLQISSTGDPSSLRVEIVKLRCTPAFKNAFASEEIAAPETGPAPGIVEQSLPTVEATIIVHDAVEKFPRSMAAGFMIGVTKLYFEKSKTSTLSSVP